MALKILFVDDEQNILDGIERQFRKKLEIVTALGAHKGLSALQQLGPFAVVVSDMRMPEMDGVQFLNLVKQCYPDMVRIMLTGNADQETAVKAVNEGNIFRFLTKPCPAEKISEVLQEAMEQYRLRQLEKDLLENTLQGAVKALVDILSLTNPLAFGRANRLKYFVSQIGAILEIKDTWKYELAALLSQVGCVTIPASILEKYYRRESLLEEEAKMLKDFPKTAYEILVKIPRLEEIAEMVLYQQEVWKADVKETVLERPSKVLGAEILGVAVELDALLIQGKNKGEAMDTFKRKSKQFNPEIVASLEKIKLLSKEKKVVSMPVRLLHSLMTLEQDVLSKTGVLLAKKDQEISPALKILMENYVKQKNLEEPILVSEKII